MFLWFTYISIEIVPLAVTLDTSLPSGIAMALGLLTTAERPSVSLVKPKYSHIPDVSTGLNILTLLRCMPDSIGTWHEPYDFTYSYPVYVLPIQYKTSYGHPEGVIDLYEISNGKFQTSLLFENEL